MEIRQGMNGMTKVDINMILMTRYELRISQSTPV